MTAALDTSVVVRLLVGQPVGQAVAARKLIEGGLAAVSDLVVGESYFALRHHYRVPHEHAVAALRALLADPRVTATGVAREVLAAAPERDVPPGLMDRLIHADYRGAGVEFTTFDRDAASLEGGRLLSS